MRTLERKAVSTLIERAALHDELVHRASSTHWSRKVAAEDRISPAFVHAAPGLPKSERGVPVSIEVIPVFVTFEL